MTEQPVQRREITEKLSNLRNLGTIFSRDERKVYSFCEYLAEQIGYDGKILPSGFLAGVYQSVYDLQNGISGWDGELIRNGLSNMPPKSYQPILDVIHEIVWTTCPKEFAEKVILHKFRTQLQLRRLMEQKGVRNYTEAEHILGLNLFL